MKNSNANCEPLAATAAATLSPFSGRCIIVNGPVIVGAGPSGLAVAASLRLQGVPFVILERATCVASLWQSRTYDRLSLHLPKSFCRLPHLDFPAGLPEYPSRAQFVDYLESYTYHFDIRPRFGEVVIRAEQDKTCGLWRVKTVAAAGGDEPAVAETEYLCRWLVVATGENAEKVMPEIEGLASFGGNVMHARDYKSGRSFSERRVLVVGCGNSGMEISLDLAHHGALPAMVVRSSIHVMPREILGLSTYGLACTLCKWLPIRAVDTILLAASRLILGKTEDYGLKRPSIGPLELKNTLGKTPVLDLGTLSLIKSGDISVVPGIKRFLQNGVELVNGEILEIDSVIMATGYSSNVPSWLKESDFFLKNGFPKMPFPNGWKGREGLYAVGFGRKGLAGAATDAVKVAKDIASNWNQETMRNNGSSKAHALSYN